VLKGSSIGLAVAGRNWRGLGFRVVGLCRVDALTGGPVSLHGALLGQLFDQAWQAATLAGPVISQSMLALGSRQGRTVRDRITGTCVIVDRKQRPLGGAA
jgi:hypothetical protein